MDRHTGRFGGMGEAVLGVVAVGLCCGAPLLIVAGAALVAAVGWTDLGMGAGIALLVASAVLALLRFPQLGRHTRSVTGRQPDSVHKER